MAEVISFAKECNYDIWFSKENWLKKVYNPEYPIKYKTSKNDEIEIPVHGIAFPFDRTQTINEIMEGTKRQYDGLCKYMLQKHWYDSFAFECPDTMELKDFEKYFNGIIYITRVQIIATQTDVVYVTSEFGLVIEEKEDDA